MVFVADEIPPELRRIVDFLASQLRSAEVYAIEVRNYQGANERALVPRLVSTPKPSSAAMGQVQWDEESFFRELARRKPEGVDVARRLFEWAREQMTDVWYGNGTKMGSCIPRLQLSRTRIYLFILWTNGAVEMQFQYLRVPPFTEEERRREFVWRLNQIAGVAIPDDAVTKRPALTWLSSPTMRHCILSRTPCAGPSNT